MKSEYDKRTQSAGGSSSGGGLKEQLTAAFEQLKEQVNNYIGQKKNHDERVADTGRFDYQYERMNKFSDPSPTPTLPSNEGLGEQPSPVNS